MRNCYQHPSQNILQHGFSVARYFSKLKSSVHLSEIEGWKLPCWWNDTALWDNVLPYDDMIKYMIYHDMGKPMCRTVDDLGTHFYNHAQVSYDLSVKCFGEGDISQLILHDMDMHTMTNDQIDGIIDMRLYPSLLISALCELHSNANMFGGISSPGFKIKYKKLDKRGKKIISMLAHQRQI